MRDVISTKGPARSHSHTTRGMPVTNTCPRRKKLRQSTVDDQPVIWKLVQRFPLFAAPTPMKLGVNAELQQFCRAAIPEDLMSRTRVRLAVNYFLSRWARQPEYQAVLKAGGLRYDLWMKPCGGILDEETDYRKFRMMRQDAAKPTNSQT